MPNFQNPDTMQGGIAHRFEIETIGPENIEVLAQLHAQCFETPWDSAAFATLLGQPTTRAWLAFPITPPSAETRRPIGFAVLRTVADEAEILTIGVVPDARKKGAGRFLLTAVLADLAGLGVARVFLEVAVSNGAAIALYAGAGFVCIGTRKNYAKVQGKPQDADIMRVVLGSKFCPI